MNNRLFLSSILGLSFAVIASASYALIVPDATLPTTLLDMPAPTIEETAEEPAEPPIRIRQYTVRRGDNLAAIFARLDLPRGWVQQLTDHPHGRELTRLTPGETLQLLLTSEGELAQLIFNKPPLHTFIATPQADGLLLEKHSKPVERRTVTIQGVIHNSLFVDGKTAGLSDKAILQLADIFAWDIDFALDLRAGDQFTVIYDARFVDGKVWHSGDILAAEFVNQGKVYRAVRYRDARGRTHYYTPEGNGLRKAFLRSPVDYVRISSYFTPHRHHPILNTIRAHKGVDYAAPTGTPVRAVGAGKIVFRGTQNGYGNTLIVQHGAHYSTLYAHLSRFDARFRVGDSVEQGDIIGYVGQTGLATGPHLHFEFRIDDVHHDPLTVALPHSLPIASHLRADFQRQIALWLAQLERAHSQVAQTTPAQ